MKKLKVLVLGGTGMLGHVLYRTLSARPELDVCSTTRNARALPKFFSPELVRGFRNVGVDADNFDTVIRALASFQPDVVINCIGLIKQLPVASDPLSAITVNAQLPHRLSMVCRTAAARLIHISTDCVFDGHKGMYTEEDLSNANDLYGKTKYLGEVNYPHCVTLRTSIIGHELKGGLSLVEWFLSQGGKIRGFTKAIYSGLPTVEMSRIIADYVLQNESLSGTYHVSAEPISKYNLLRIVAKQYHKLIEIEPFDGFLQDRSLDSSKFKFATGYIPPSWPELIMKMHNDYTENKTMHGYRS